MCIKLEIFSIFLVASKVGNLPKPTTWTRQHMRILQHVEANELACSISNLDGSVSSLQSISKSGSEDRFYQSTTVGSDEWFIPAQSSILNCLLERVCVCLKHLI